MSFTGDV